MATMTVETAEQKAAEAAQKARELRAAEDQKRDDEERAARAEKIALAEHDRDNFDTHRQAVRDAWDGFLAAVNGAGDSVHAFVTYRHTLARAEKTARRIKSVLFNAALDDHEQAVRTVNDANQELQHILKARAGGAEDAYADRLARINETLNTLADDQGVAVHRAPDDTAWVHTIHYSNKPSDSSFSVHVGTFITDFPQALEKAIGDTYK